MVAVPDDAGETLMKLIEVLDDHDDVQNVYGNYELSDALMAKLSGLISPSATIDAAWHRRPHSRPSAVHVDGEAGDLS